VVEHGVTRGLVALARDLGSVPLCGKPGSVGLGRFGGCVVFGAWCLEQYGQGGGSGYMTAAIAAFAASLGLVVYDSWFLRKTRALG